MTTAEDLRLQREQHDQALRAASRLQAASSWPMSPSATASTTGQARQLLDMCGLLGDPEDDGIPVVLPHAFHQPAAKLSAPAAGSYR